MPCFYAFTVDLQSFVEWLSNRKLLYVIVEGVGSTSVRSSDPLCHAVFQTTSGWKWPTAAPVIVQYHISIQHPFDCSDELKWQVKMPPPQPENMIYGKEAKTIIAFLLLLFFQG